MVHGIGGEGGGIVRNAEGHVLEVLVRQQNGFQLLDDVCEDFNRMAEELQSVRTLREDFLNSYSHEFKTPITAIKGFAELLSEPDITEEERQQYLRIIQEESARLAELTNRTLLLTKLESQRFVPDQTTFSLDEQIRRCAILYAHSWEEKHLTFSAELETVDCTGSEELLRQVWLNLLNNAIRYTPPGGRDRRGTEADGKGSRRPGVGHRRGYDGGGPGPHF